MAVYLVSCSDYWEPRGLTDVVMPSSSLHDAKLRADSILDHKGPGYFVEVLQVIDGTTAGRLYRKDFLIGNDSPSKWRITRNQHFPLTAG